MDLQTIHNVIGVFGTIISLSLGLLMFPVQIIKIYEDNRSTKPFSTSMGFLPFMTYTLWWLYGATFPDGMDIFMVIANSPGLITSFWFLLLFYLDDRKILIETKNDIAGLIKFIFRALKRGLRQPKEKEKWKNVLRRSLNQRLFYYKKNYASWHNLF